MLSITSFPWRIILQNHSVKISKPYSILSISFLGPRPNLICRDLSNNTFAVSEVPTWFSTLKLLTTLYVFILLPYIIREANGNMFSGTHAYTLSLSACICIWNIIKKLRKIKFLRLTATLYCRMMENTGLQGEVPRALFSFGNLETVWVSYSSL